MRVTVTVPDLTVPSPTDVAAALRNDPEYAEMFEDVDYFALLGSHISNAVAVAAGAGLLGTGVTEQLVRFWPGADDEGALEGGLATVEAGVGQPWAPKFAVALGLRRLVPDRSISGPELLAQVVVNIASGLHQGLQDLHDT